MLTLVFAGKQRIACKRFTHKGHFRLPASTGSFSAGYRCLGQFRYDSIRVFVFSSIFPQGDIRVPAVFIFWILSSIIFCIDSFYTC